MSLIGLKIVRDIFRLQYIAENDINIVCFGGFSCIANGGISDFVQGAAERTPLFGKLIN
jgi:hypothetical protein